MQKISDQIKKFLAANGCTGDIDGVQIQDGLGEGNLDIKSCVFLGKNKIYGRISILNSTIENSQILDDVSISGSIVRNSFIGSNTLIMDYSIVSNTVISPMTLPESKTTYISVIKNSQISGDVILGGCDFNKTKSRGQSVFAFAHIGGGEFKGNVIIGNPPTAKSEKTLVEIGHFGYYGNLLILSFRVADKQDHSFDLDSDDYFDATKKALLNILFETSLPDNVTIKKGRTNIGAGTVISNYDPIKETKAGAIIILSSIGANVSLSPYLTVLPNSLIASGSVDVTREKNVISENSLVIGARSQAVVLENYYDASKRQIMNDRSVEEMTYLERNLAFFGILAEVFAEGVNSEDSFESFAMGQALGEIKKAALEITQKSLPEYFELLKKSVRSIEKIISQDPSRAKDFEGRLRAHSSVLDRKEKIKSIANSRLEDINRFSQKYNDIDEDILFEQGKKTDGNYKNVVLTRKQGSAVGELFLQNQHEKE